MSRVRDVLAILKSSKSPLVMGVYCLNMALYAVRSKKRIHRIPMARLNIGGKAYFVNSWDGLLVARPGHEPKVNAAVKEVAESREGGTFVNVGAHIGRYVIEFAEHFDRTIAYEPTPETFGLLARAIEQHPVRERIIARQMCAADRSEPVLFQVTTSESQNSMLAGDDFRSVRALRIEAVTLDEDLTDEEKQSLRLLLIDVEGAEELVLRGARDALQVGSPVVIAEFLSEDRRRACDAFLTALGYRGRAIDATNWRYARV